MTVNGQIEGESVVIATPPGSLASISVHEADGGFSITRIDSNHLRVLAQLASAAADELDARSIGP